QGKERDVLQLNVLVGKIIADARAQQEDDAGDHDNEVAHLVAFAAGIKQVVPIIDHIERDKHHPAHQQKLVDVEEGVVPDGKHRDHERYGNKNTHDQGKEFHKHVFLTFQMNSVIAKQQQRNRRYGENRQFQGARKLVGAKKYRK